MILLDTNLLTRMTRSQDPQVGVARAAIQTLLGQNERLIVAPQNLYEFWAVATRAPGPPPAGRNGRNGLGLTGEVFEAGAAGVTRELGEPAEE